MPLPYLLREATPEDESFIRNSWLTSLHDHSQLSYVQRSVYFREQNKILDYLLSTSSVLIACFPEAPDQIMGYVVYDHIIKTLVLHWVYVKSMFRMQGIALGMIKPLLDPDNTVIVCTHITHAFKHLKDKVPGKHCLYDPYLVTNKRLLPYTDVPK